MITYIKGILTKATPGYAVIEAGGLGYQVFIPTSAYTHLPAIGSEIKLYTSFVVREISQTLYGFLSEEERDLFEEVTGVSGIGPKIALSLIGHLPISQLRGAVTNHDVTAISRVPGIGKKTAQRLIIEMRDRMGKSSKMNLPSDFAIQFDSNPHAQKISDAIQALMNLGYQQAVAHKAIQKTLKTLPDSSDLPTLITDALKNV